MGGIATQSPGYDFFSRLLVLSVKATARLLPGVAPVAPACSPNISEQTFYRSADHDVVRL